MFEIRKLIQRFRQTQYSEGQLIKDLQKLIDDLNGNLVSIQDKINEIDAEYGPLIGLQTTVSQLVLDLDVAEGAIDTAELDIDNLEAAVSALNAQRPRFAAYGAGPSVSTSANQIFKPNNVPLNVGNGYSTVTGRFTCPVAGMYKIEYKGLEGQTGAYSAHTQLWKNGAQASLSHSNVTNYTMGHLFYEGQCNAGDYFEVALIAGYAMYSAADTTYNWFWGELVR